MIQDILHHFTYMRKFHFFTNYYGENTLHLLNYPTLFIGQFLAFCTTFFGKENLFFNLRVYP